VISLSQNSVHSEGNNRGYEKQFHHTYPSTKSLDEVTFVNRHDLGDECLQMKDSFASGTQPVFLEVISVT
jgi:hypothetical protein